MSRYVVSQRHLGHVAQILHQVLSAVGVSRGAHRGQAEQDRGPRGRVIRGQHVVHVNPARSGRDQIDQEDRGDEGERQGRFVLPHFGELGDESGRERLEDPHHGRRGAQDDEAKEQSGPKPVVFEGADRRLGQRDSDQPKAFPGDGDEQLGPVLIPTKHKAID